MKLSKLKSKIVRWVKKILRRQRWTFSISFLTLVILVGVMFFASGCVSCYNSRGEGQYSDCSVIGQSGNGKTAPEEKKKL